MNLAMLRPGQRGRITTIGAIGPMKRRLMDMGDMGRLISRLCGQNNMLTKACFCHKVLKTPGMNPGPHTVKLLLN